LERAGLTAVGAQLDDMLAHASNQRWSPRQLLEQLAQIEVAERAHRSLERRLRSRWTSLPRRAILFWSAPNRGTGQAVFACLRGLRDQVRLAFISWSFYFALQGRPLGSVNI
jgi:DNA replication protein DnaC